MRSGAHAVISLVVAGLALALTDPPFAAPVVVGVALAVGLGVDLDHFVLAWWRTGGLDPVFRCLRDPRILFVEQDAIFEDGDVGAINRLLSHAVIGGVAVPLCRVVSPYLAGLVGVALYAHLLADLWATSRDAVAVERDDPRIQ